MVVSIRFPICCIGNNVLLVCTAHGRHPACGIASPMHLNGAGDGLDYDISNYIVQAAAEQDALAPRHR
jgi:hypothetical protein